MIFRATSRLPSTDSTGAGKYPRHSGHTVPLIAQHRHRHISVSQLLRRIALALPPGERNPTNAAINSSPSKPARIPRRIVTSRASRMIDNLGNLPGNRCFDIPRLKRASQKSRFLFACQIRRCLPRNFSIDLPDSGIAIGSNRFQSSSECRMPLCSCQTKASIPSSVICLVRYRLDVPLSSSETSPVQTNCCQTLRGVSPEFQLWDSFGVLGRATPPEWDTFQNETEPV